MNDNLLHWKSALSRLTKIDTDSCIVDQRYGLISPITGPGTDYYKMIDGNNKNNSIIIKICGITGQIDEFVIYTIDGFYPFFGDKTSKKQIHSFLVKLLAKEEQFNGIGTRSSKLFPALRKYYNRKAGL